MYPRMRNGLLKMLLQSEAATAVWYSGNLSPELLLRDRGGGGFRELVAAIRVRFRVWGWRRGADVEGV